MTKALVPIIVHEQIIVLSIDQIMTPLVRNRKIEMICNLFEGSYHLSQNEQEIKRSENDGGVGLTFNENPGLFDSVEVKKRFSSSFRCAFRNDFRGSSAGMAETTCHGLVTWRDVTLRNRRAPRVPRKFHSRSVHDLRRTCAADSSGFSLWFTSRIPPVDAVHSGDRLFQEPIDPRVSPRSMENGESKGLNFLYLFGNNYTLPE